MAWVASLAGRNDLPLLRSADLAEPILADAAEAVLAEVAERHATFSRMNLLAEAHRLLHGARFASPDERVDVAERVTALATGRSVALAPAGEAHVPRRYQRADGSSRLRPESRLAYTTQALLDAEARLLEAGRDSTGPSVPVATVAAVADANLPGRGYGLSLDQAVAVEKVATSGRVLDVLVGPAGTGKSTTMAGLRAAWEAEHGPGSVVGLAPSAAAAEVLAQELGIATENTAKWLTEWRRTPELVARRGVLAERLQHHPRPLSPGAQQLRLAVAALDDDIAARKLRPGQLVVVDEASLAGTFSLDELVSAARGAGAKVLLAGDWAQLSAVDAGGAFGLLVRDRAELAPQLTEVRRFHNEWERVASTALRLGREEAVATYEDHGRVSGGGRPEMLERLYQSWKADVAVGKSSLMIAPDTATVAELNRRARQDRVDAGEVLADGVALAGGQVAGVGDVVVTRENNRLLGTAKSWVKNGDRWTVTAANEDGSMALRRLNGNGEVTLPADYVAHHVELAYATTAHRAQGCTVRDRPRLCLAHHDPGGPLCGRHPGPRGEPALRGHGLRPRPGHLALRAGRAPERDRSPYPRPCPTGGGPLCPRGAPAGVPASGELGGPGPGVQHDRPGGPAPALGRSVGWLRVGRTGPPGRAGEPSVRAAPGLDARSRGAGPKGRRRPAQAGARSQVRRRHRPRRCPAREGPALDGSSCKQAPGSGRPGGRPPPQSAGRC